MTRVRRSLCILACLVAILVPRMGHTQSATTLWPLSDTFDITNRGDVHYGVDVVQTQTAASVIPDTLIQGYRWSYQLLGTAAGFSAATGVYLHPYLGGGNGVSVTGVTMSPEVGELLNSSANAITYFQAYLTGNGCTLGVNCQTISEQFVLANTAPPLGTSSNYYLLSNGGTSGGQVWQSYLDHGLRLGGALSGATSGYFLDVAGGNALITGNLDMTGTALTNSNLTAGAGCGTSPTMGALSTDTAGTFTVGTLATQCTLTFAATKAQIPRCFANDQTGNAVAVQIIPSTTTLVFSTATAATISSDVIDYFCVGKH